MPTTTNYGWTTPADTDLVKDGASAIRTLGTAIDTTVFNNASASIAKTIVDAKGDIIAATAADTVSKLSVGANDTVLTADSSTATGLKWAASASGGMTLISTTTLSGATTTLSSIPQTYNSLYLIVTGLTFNTSNQGFRLSPNDQTTLSNWSGVQNSSVIGGIDQTMYLSTGTDVLRTNANNIWTIQINNYTSSTSWKTFNWVGAFTNSVSDPYRNFIGGTFKSNTAISSLVFDVERTNTFATGTVLLYGVK